MVKKLYYDFESAPADYAWSLVEISGKITETRAPQNSKWLCKDPARVLTGWSPSVLHNSLVRGTFTILSVKRRIVLLTLGNASQDIGNVSCR